MMFVVSKKQKSMKTTLQTFYHLHLMNLNWKETLEKRVGVYVIKHLKYTRREDIEEPNTHVIIIDFEFNCNLRVISLYRSFRPPNGLTPLTLFEKQLDIVERNCISNTFVLSDFNLHFKMLL